MSAHDDWAAYLDPGDESFPVDGSADSLTPEVTSALDRIGDLLATDEVWDGPPPGLRARLLAEAAGSARADVGTTAGFDADAGLDSGVDFDADFGASLPERAGGVDPASGPERGVPADPGRPGSARARARARWFGTAVAAIAATAAAIALVAWPRFQADDVPTYEVAGTPLAPDARAEVRIERLGTGMAITLDVTGLEPAAEGEYYAGWLLADDGSVVGIGSFHLREPGEPVELWSGVAVDRYPTFAVTRQREGEPPLPSDQMVLRGPVVDVGQG